MVAVQGKGIAAAVRVIVAVKVVAVASAIREAMGISRKAPKPVRLAKAAVVMMAALKKT